MKTQEEIWQAKILRLRTKRRSENFITSDRGDRSSFVAEAGARRKVTIILLSFTERNYFCGCAL
jgi:hypothetical protein